MTLPVVDLAASSDAQLREEIRICARYWGALHPADISPFDPLYRGYDDAGDADRARLDALFDEVLLDPEADLRLAAIRHLARTGGAPALEKLVGAMRAHPELFGDQVGTTGAKVREEADLALRALGANPLV